MRLVLALATGFAACTMGIGCPLFGTRDAVPATLEAATSPGNVPFEMPALDGTLCGLDVALGEHLARELGRAGVTWRMIRWKHLLDVVSAHECDLAISGISVTPERRKLVDFSKPYATVTKAMLVPLAPPREFPIETEPHAELSGTIVVPEATTSADLATQFFPKAKVRSLATEQLAALEVLEGRADGMLFDAPFLRAVERRNPKRVKVVELPNLPREDIAIAVAKGRPDLLAAIDGALDKLRAEGTLAALEQEYLVDAAWLEKVVGPR